MARRGEVHEYETFRTVCDGAYFDWPWWKRRLSDCADLGYPQFNGVRWVLLRLRTRPWRHFRQGNYVYPSLAEMYMLGKSIASSKVKPIFWKWENKAGEPRPNVR